MTTRVHVTDGLVDIHSIPTVGRLSDGRVVSGFDNLPDEILRSEGWFPLDDSIPEFNPETHSLEDDGFMVLSDKVLKKWNVQPRGPMLTSSVEHIPPDGVTSASVQYRNHRSDAPASVVFSVNGVSSAPANLVDGLATVNVVSTTPNDTVKITAGGVELKIGVTNG